MTHTHIQGSVRVENNIISFSPSSVLRSDYHYGLFFHKLTKPDGVVFTRPLIVLRSKCDDIVRFTKLHSFAEPFTGKVCTPLNSGGHERLYHICAMLNYILIDRYEQFEVDHVFDVTWEAVNTFFQSYAYEQSAAGKFRSRATIEKCINHATDFFRRLKSRFGALHSTDFPRLPAPRLPYERERILDDILNGVFPEHFAAALTDELTIRLQMKCPKPSKTETYQNIPELKLFIPESLRVPLGIIIAITLAHHPDPQPGGQLIFLRDYSRLYKRFFGSEFAAAMGRRPLSVRRCNKSYLQGIDAAASLKNEPGKPKGYMLAALARSHKGGIGTLPEITEIYLKDANFTGYSPEFIAGEMFERGVFSFIPAALLEIYAGEDYKLLPIHSQTLLIQEIGLRPSQIENLLITAESALRKARDTVTSLVSSLRMEKRGTGQVLQNIASGNAPGRTRECLCLMTAVSWPCSYPNRAGCIGCGYEILTKSALRLLMREFNRFKQLRENAPKSEVWRYTALLNEAALPAIAEIISCAKALAPDEELSLLFDVIEGGI